MANNQTEVPDGGEAENRWTLVDRMIDVTKVPAGDSKWTEPFFFVQAADSQFGLIDRYLKKLEVIGWEEEMAYSEELIAACHRMEPKPKFMVICGDLLDAGPRTEMRRRQIVDFRRIFSKLDASIPLVCVCGNHDVGDEPTMEFIQEYKRDFGPDYFYFTLPGVLFIVINSQFYQHRAFVQDYAKQQDEWLEAILAKCKQFKYSIVFEHIPWFINDPNEEDEYFNIPRQLRLEWLNKFKAAGVDKIMCGHYHRNAGGWLDGMELVVTSAIGAQLGADKSGARLVRVLEGGIEHQYYAMGELPHKVNLC